MHSCPPPNTGGSLKPGGGGGGPTTILGLGIVGNDGCGTIVVPIAILVLSMEIDHRDCGSDGQRVRAQRAFSRFWSGDKGSVLVAAATLRASYSKRTASGRQSHLSDLNQKLLVLGKHFRLNFMEGRQRAIGGILLVFPTKPHYRHCVYSKSSNECPFTKGSKVDVRRCYAPKEGGSGGVIRDRKTRSLPFSTCPKKN